MTISSFENFNSLAEKDTSKYIGEWVAIINKKIVANGTDLSSLMKEVKDRFPDKEPLVAKIPPKAMLII